jgi:beta-lactam-binding protein with PASTA domain
VVLFHDPKSETSVSKNTMVQIVVSAGIPPSSIVLMPDFRQKKIDEAYDWSTKTGYKINVNDDENSLFLYGTVIEQEPVPDSVVLEDTKIIFTMSARKSAPESNKEFQIHYEVSQSGSQRHIRIVAVGTTGDREIFNGLRDPGSKIDLTLPYGSAGKIRIFVNGVLVEERPVK